MTTYTSRPFENEHDLQALHQFLIELRAQRGHLAYWHIGDLTWRFFLQELRGDPRDIIRLWHDARGALAGFAWFAYDYAFDWQLRVDASARGIEDEMLAWAKEHWASALPNASGEKPSLWSDALEKDDVRSAFLERNRFARGDKPMIYFQRALDEAFLTPKLPDGFSIRAVRAADAANRAGAHREAFHPSRVTDEGYARLMQMPEYDREQDVVTVAPDGVIAAFAMSWVDLVNRLGEFEPVGARVAYRQRGLTKAVLLEGMRRMRTRGAAIASVWTNEDNVAAVRLYESVGFTRVDRDWNYVLHQ
ncbi:MAG: GNAT family N-acetyltransferase [Chloroflexi bacterium]|nr:GNAT family N-acetyltransferase [Chloroflexota bacterium]